MSSNAYDNQLKIIDCIKFEILQNAVIKKMSVFGENSLGVEVYDLYESGSPKAGSLIDTRFGPNNPTDICSTCGLQTLYCVGHTGHITLAEHVFHPKFIDQCKKILNCICLKCSKILFYKNEEEIKIQLMNKPPKERLQRLKKGVQSVNYCQSCGTMVTKIKKEKKPQLGTMQLISEANLQNIPVEEGGSAVEKKKPRQILTPEIVYDILKNISEEDCNLMGLMVRPENLIIKELHIPPTSIRPSAKADFAASSRLEDNLTTALVEVTRTNVKLRKFKENPTQNAKTINDNRTLLSCHIGAYLDNNSGCSIGSDKGKNLKSLSARIKGKEGRIRTNLMGKRVNFSGRTVITPDPTLDINQLGLPIKIAKNLTFPEIVTPYNIERLQLLVRNARTVYPGANYVTRKLKNEEEQMFDLRFSKEKVILQYGDVVDRQLVNGDFVLLNRQPTLHKLSMMGHKVKVIEDDNLETFRLCPNVTTPYNADFDGDEMNIHVPQSLQTSIELSEKADAAKQIISPRNGGPAIGTVQDVLVGAYNITNPETTINWQSAMNILTHTNLNFDELLLLEKGKDIKGKDLFSFVIPDGINLSRETVKITNGKLEQGRIDKSLIGPSAGGIIHYIWDRYGYKETANFLSNVQRLTNNYNFYRGFTCGISDVFIGKESEIEIDLVVQRKLIEVCNRITILENNPNLLDVQTFENSINASLNVVLNDVSKIIVDKMPITNNFKTMLKSGSKGSESNSGQMAGCVGQQAVEGSRPKKKCNRRTLPYFAQNDDTPSARGFSRSCFSRGLNPTEFIFQNQSSRVGLMDTAIKTAESGYIQRKLVKALEDIMINYDSTVRSANYVILQFTYGDDGLNPTKQYKHNLSILVMSDAQIKDKFVGNLLNKEQTDNLFNKIIKLRDTVRYNKMKQAAEYLLFDSSNMLAIDLNRLILDAKNLKDKDRNNEKLTAEYVMKNIKNILKYENTQVTCMKKNTDKKSIKFGDEKASKIIFKLALFNYLSPKLCIDEYGFNKYQFDYLRDEIIKSFNRSMVEPGEMVGILAAQSIGEPTTQLTLNTFHFAGIGSKSSQSLGVPRMKELMNCTTNLKVAYMSIYVDKKYASNKSIVDKITSHIKYTNMKHINDEINIFYDPNMYEKSSIMARDGVKNIFHQINTTKLSCQNDITSLPWLVRVVLNREKLLEKNITLMDIKTKFCDCWEKRYKNLKNIKGQEKVVFNRVTQCAILSNNENDSVPIIHIRLDMSVVDFNTLKQFVDIFVENFELKGIPNVTDVSSVEQDKKLTAFDTETGEMIKENNTILTTDGVNLSALRYLNGIDIHKTITNDIVEIYNKFGIEAARNKIINELDGVLKSSNISFHHLSLLADLMTNTGVLTSIDRHGLHKLNVDALARASFEKPVEQLINAAIYNETDHLSSVSSRIMTGLAIKGGTGVCNILLDSDLLESSEYDADAQFKYKKSTKEFTFDPIINDIINNNNIM